MAKLAIVKASTDVTQYIFVQDSSETDGSGLTGLAFNTASLTAYYVRPLGNATEIELATQTVTGAHDDGGFVEVDSTNMPGVYRLDLPDAVCATGVDSVVVMLKGATNMAPVVLEIQLTNFDLNDGVRAGLTALPNAAADGPGGLAISDAGGLDLDAIPTAQATAQADLDILTGTDGATLATSQANYAPAKVGDEMDLVDAPNATAVTAIQNGLATSSEVGDIPTNAEFNARTLAAADYFDPGADTVTVGTNNDKTGYSLSSAGIQAIWDALTSALAAAGSIGKLLVDNINATISSRSSHSAADVWSSGTRTLTASTNFNDLSEAQVNAQVDAAIETYHLDHLLAADYDPASKPGAATALLNELIESDSGASRFTANALEEAPTGGSAPTVEDIRTEIDANSTQLAAIVADTNELQGDWTNGGRLDLIIDAILADTNELQSDDVPGLIAALDLLIDDILEDTGTTLPALIAALNDLSAAQVNAEVVDALATDTYAEPDSVPAATATLSAKIGWLFLLARNKVTQTSTTQAVRNDADSADVATAAVADDGTTATRGEWT